MAYRHLTFRVLRLSSKYILPFCTLLLLTLSRLTIPTSAVSLHPNESPPGGSLSPDTLDFDSIKNAIMDMGSHAAKILPHLSMDDLTKLKTKVEQRGQAVLPRLLADITNGLQGVSIDNSQQQAAKFAELTKNNPELAREVNDLKSTRSLLHSAKASDLTALRNVAGRRQKKLSEAGGYLWKISEDQKKLYDDIKKINSEFFDHHRNDVANPQDIPRAILTHEQQVNTTQYQNMTGLDHGLDCPYTCDPTFCTNKLEEDMQCFKITFRPNSPENDRICTKFENFDSFKCPDGYQRCAMAAPDKGSVYHMYSSDKTQPYPQPLSITGWNLNQCLRLYIIPHEASCGINPQEITQSLNSSIPIMGFSGTPSYPRLFPLLNGKQEALFYDIQIFDEGLFNICLMQFHKDSTKLQILAATDIGFVNATRDEELLIAFADFRRRGNTAVSLNAPKKTIILLLLFTLTFLFVF